jgi:hypothetical protein
MKKLILIAVAALSLSAFAGNPPFFPEGNAAGSSGESDSRVLQKILGALHDTVPASASAVTTSDSATIPATSALYIGVSGDVKVDFAGTGTVTLKAVPVGFLPVKVVKVYAAGTTATNIIALY